MCHLNLQKFLEKKNSVIAKVWLCKWVQSFWRTIFFNMFQNSYSISRNCANAITRSLPRRSGGKNSPCNAGDRFNPWSRKIPHVTQQLSPSASATEALPPVLTTREATTTREAWALQWRGAPARCTQRKPRRSNKDPEQPKIINTFLIKGIIRNIHLTV